MATINLKDCKATTEFYLRQQGPPFTDQGSIVEVFTDLSLLAAPKVSLIGATPTRRRRACAAKQ